MKTRIILVISLCANAGLVAAYFAVSRPPQTDIAPASETITTIVEKSGPIHKRIVAVSTEVTKDFKWSSVEAEDYKEYIANLRAIGCPEETIRDIIIADVNKLFGTKMARLRVSPTEFKFWQTENRDTRTAERERRTKIRELDQEKRALIKELLGIDLDQEMARWEGREDADAWRYAFLSPEKQTQLREINEKYREMQRALFAEGGGGGGPETRTRMLAMRAEQEAEMAKLMSPSEYQEYQLRNSATARNMRDNLGIFEPSEQEFREIFNLRKTFDDQYAFQRGGGDDAALGQRRAAEQKLEDQLKAMLGEQRYKEYAMAQDDRYQSINNFAQENNLSKTAVQQVYDVQVTAETEANRIRNDSSIPAEQKQILLTAIAEQTSKTLNSVMGDSFSAYQSENGRWLARLTRENQRGGFGGPGGRGGNGGGRRGQGP